MEDTHDRVAGMAAILLAQAGGDREQAIKEARHEKRSRTDDDARQHFSGVIRCLEEEREDQEVYEYHLDALDRSLADRYLEDYGGDPRGG